MRRKAEKSSQTVAERKKDRRRKPEYKAVSLALDLGEDGGTLHRRTKPAKEVRNGSAENRDREQDGGGNERRRNSFIVRILHLNSARKYIGEAAHTVNLVAALRRRGHEVSVGLRRGWPTFERAAADGLEPVGLRLRHRWWPPDDLADLRLIARLVRGRGLEIIHAHRGKDHWQALAASKLFRLRAPLIRTRHVVTPWAAHVANRLQARLTARLVAVSKAVRDDVFRAGLYPPEKVVLIPGGVDLERFHPPSLEKRAAARAALGLDAGTRAVFCVARMAKVKAHRVLLPAWKAALERRPSPRAELFLVGGGLLEKEVRALAAQLRLEKTVRFLGVRDDVPELLAAADLGVLASVGSEGFSRAVLEYMACGLPTAATRVGAVPDLVTDGREGLLVAPDNQEELAAALRSALTAPPEQLAAWGRAARAKAARDHGFDTWAAAHEKLYEEVLDEAKKR